MNNVKATLEKQSWWQLTTIQIGGAICMPVLMAGQQIAIHYGLKAAIIAIVIGNLLLLGIGIPHISLAYEKKASTIENAINCFGKAGTWIVGISMIVALIGWFAIQLQLVGLSTLHLINLFIGNNIIPSSMVIIIWGIIMTGMSMRGIKGVTMLADYSMPLLIGTIAYAAIKASAMPLIQTQPEVGLLKGITLIITSTLLVVIDIPTYYRHSQSRKDGYISLFVLYAIATPVIQFVGAYIAMHSYGGSIVDTFAQQGGVLWQLWISAFLVLAGWTTNNTNIYSAAVTLESLLPSLSHYWRTISIGLIGTIVACFPMLNHYEKTLSAMTILIGSMGAIVITSFLFNRYIYVLKESNSKTYALGSWVIGSLTGFLSFLGYIHITGSALLDTFSIATICTFFSFLTTVYSQKHPEGNS